MVLPSFALDPRSLAAFRVGLAATVLLDLRARAAELDLWLTDDGLFPCEVRQHFLQHTWLTTLHCLDSTSTGQAVLLSAAAVAATALLLGRCCRCASGVTWLLTSSLHARNPLTLHGGDVLLRLLLFWSLFVPLRPPTSQDDAGTPRARGA